MPITSNVELIRHLAWVLSTASARHVLDMPGEFVWAYPKDQKFHEIRSRSRSIYSSGNAIKDSDVDTFVQSLHLAPYLKNPWIVNQFQDRFPQWVNSGPGYNLKNLDLFRYVGFSQGTQESFLNWYMMHKDRRLRVFRGDYWWHMEIWTKAGFQWSYMDDEPEILPNDACVVSYPFALTGTKHPQMDWLIHECNRVGCDLLVDFIYLFNSHNVVDIDLSAPCIQEITFSLSKTFAVQTAKIAVRMLKTKPSDPMQMSNDENICNRLGAGLGLELINKFAPDYMVNKYHTKQKIWCDFLGLSPTPVIHFALGDNYTTVGRQTELNYLSVYNEQQNRYNLGMLFENQKLLQQLNLYPQTESLNAVA